MLPLFSFFIRLSAKSAGGIMKRGALIAFAHYTIFIAAMK
jgi:hypothetical protein